MKEYLKPKVVEPTKEAPKEFNHEEHMEKVARTASEIIRLAQGLLSEEENEEQAEEKGTLFDKVMKKIR